MAINRATALADITSIETDLQAFQATHLAHANAVEEGKWSSYRAAVQRALEQTRQIKEMLQRGGDANL